MDCTKHLTNIEMLCGEQEHPYQHPGCKLAAYCLQAMAHLWPMSSTVSNPSTPASQKLSYIDCSLSLIHYQSCCRYSLLYCLGPHEFLPVNIVPLTTPKFLTLTEQFLASVQDYTRNCLSLPDSTRLGRSLPSLRATIEFRPKMQYSTV